MDKRFRSLNMQGPATQIADKDVLTPVVPLLKKEGLPLSGNPSFDIRF